uniref:Uncharacterized protein n=1 Tax=Rhizophora mucronata TaxID=61149 RepID=A0A2P2QCN5_RHIMU
MKLVLFFLFGTDIYMCNNLLTNYVLFCSVRLVAIRPPHSTIKPLSIHLSNPPMTKKYVSLYF